MIAASGRELITPPAVEVVTFDDFAAHHNLYDPAEQEEVKLKIAAARQTIEQWTNLQFITATWRLAFDQFPRGNCWQDRSIPLLPRPVQSVTINYVDDAGETVELDEELYQLTTTGRPQLVPAYGFTWPIARRQPEAVTLDVVCGFGDAADDVPDWAKQAIRFLASHWYEQRESVNVGNIVTEIPQTLQLLLQTHGVETFY
jgi:uncharacterized phiE125 gp8 family phage protein